MLEIGAIVWGVRDLHRAIAFATNLPHPSRRLVPGGKGR